jgi:hypothetical protein
VYEMQLCSSLERAEEMLEQREADIMRAVQYGQSLLEKNKELRVRLEEQENGVIASTHSPHCFSGHL